MKKMKKLMCILLATVMLIGVCAGFAGAATETTTGKVPLESVSGALGWCALFEKCEDEMRSQLIYGEFDEIKEWVERLKKNLDDAWDNIFSNISVEGGQILVEVKEHEMVGQVQAQFAKYFGAEYAAKCATVVELVYEFSESYLSFGYININLLLINFFFPSRAAMLLIRKDYDNQNGVYDAKAWSEFASIRGKFIKLLEVDYDKVVTMDALIDYWTLGCEFNEAATKLMDGNKFAATLEAYMFDMPSVLQFFLKPFLRMSIRLGSMFKFF